MKLLAILEYLEPQQQETIKTALKEGKIDMVSYTKLLELLDAYKIDELRQALKENIREENQKKAGVKSSTTAIVKRLMNANKKAYNETMKKEHRFNFEGRDFYGITDGHYILASTTNLDFEEAVDHERLKMEQMFGVDYTGSYKVDLEEARIFAKEHKSAKNSKPYIIKLDNNKYIGINANYLVDSLDFCNTDTITFNGDFKSSLKSPVIIKGSNELALICTINLQDIDKNLEYMEAWKNNKN